MLEIVPTGGDNYKEVNEDAPIDVNASVEEGADEMSAEVPAPNRFRSSRANPIPTTTIPTR